MEALKGFLDRYPAGAHADDALYLLGMLYLDQNRFRKAIDSFSALFTQFPRSPRKEEAVLLVKRASEMMSQMGDQASHPVKDVFEFILPNNSTSLLLVLLGALVMAKLFWIGIGHTDKVNTDDLGRGKNVRAVARVMKDLCADHTKRNLLLAFVLMEFFAFFLNWYMGKANEEHLIREMRELLISTYSQGNFPGR